MTTIMRTTLNSRFYLFHRDGILITNDDIETGSLKKDSVVIVPKITAIDSSLISKENLIATLKDKSFKKILNDICNKFEC
ncbi:MAG: Unknown protein [uncultured Sulfurovum sp.]|uniref:Uncharacterized protein n=1 Tax=uncultured Sulfurovum sp. TaxID=269237 RepID=A0A6S6T396_9BACT|nr:MAG: Unknown protein [uncultured Sulfurovum sp.]